MSKQEVLALLLPYYKEHLEVVKGMEIRWAATDYLGAKGLHAGICYCALEVFKVSIYGANWVVDVLHARKEHWAPIPVECGNLAEIIESLQTRIDIMESLLTSESVSHA